jgi:transcription-repair coupling factor (superfamily II helicase)
MLKTLFQQPFFKELEAQFNENKNLLFEGLWDLPKALVLSYLRQIFKTDILVISGGERESRLFDDLMSLEERAFEFPAWETLPVEGIAPTLDIVGERMELFKKISENSSQIILTSLQGVLQKIPDISLIMPLYLMLKKGEDVGFETLIKKFIELGYERVSLAEDKGQFAVRGGIIDVFPISLHNPYRLDFFGDQIERIKSYDPISQNSTGEVDRIEIVPANELELTEIAPTSLLDHLKKDAIIVFDDLLKLEDRYVELKKISSSSPLVMPFEEILSRSGATLYFSKEPIEALNEGARHSKIGRDFYTGKSGSQAVVFDVFGKKLGTHRLHHPFVSFVDFFDIDTDSLEIHQKTLLERLKELPKDFAVHVFSSTRAEEASFKGHLVQTSLPDSTQFHIAYFSSGFIYPGAKIVFLPYTEFSLRQKVTRKKWRNTYHTAPSEFHQIEPGDFVVHFHNGIGKFLGIDRQKNHLGIDSEFMIIEYAGGSKLFVPMSQAHLVSRYIGASEIAPTLHTIGTKKWHQAKVKTQVAILGYAKELLQTQAEREAKGGFIYPQDSEEMQLFEEEFPYEETEDQLSAIADIKKDMLSDKPMDRLICGDVGYGKTEVAMRAAFKAAFDGKKQVAVLVPTTILATQHYETFKQRMENFGVNIDLVCRFKTAKENKRTLELVAKGQVDILVGTHRILSEDVEFKDLGLLIIDEEQRFGVRAKEKLKRLKTTVDCLTMTATPIPRTLYFSLLNIRSLSVIASPPHDRLPIKTIICDREDEVIQSAILRELARDGQVYFIHNRVETIFEIASHIETLVPAAKIGVVHGQMDGADIDEVFHKFKKGDLDILFATSIVENGIDIPRANTILIDRAHHFGISDLYQLRGRVGRWNKVAYAYFLTPRFQVLPEPSQKRLQALVSASGHGGGMKLAMMDLELRGAGDILGVQQSGQVASVGFHLYCKLLKKTIKALQENKQAHFLETRIEGKFNAQIPDYYVEDVAQRLDFYHRFGDAESLEEIDALLSQIQDRYGEAGEEVLFLYHLTRIKLFAQKHNFTLLKYEKLTLTAERESKNGPEKKSFFLPQAISGRELELITLKRLKEEFKIS